MRGQDLAAAAAATWQAPSLPESGEARRVADGADGTAWPAGAPPSFKARSASSGVGRSAA